MALTYIVAAAKLIKLRWTLKVRVKVIHFILLYEIQKFCIL